jgi:DNA-binding MarR family transcriptional regulator
VSAGDRALAMMRQRGLELADRMPGSAAAGSLGELLSVFRRRLYLPDPYPLETACATVVAHRLGGDPVWAVLVAAPGSGKTEIIQSLGGLPEVHPLSSLTAQTFASGLKGKRTASLLHRLEEAGKSFITLKDFTTVISMHREARAEVLAQLREIYDGAFRKEYGTGETVSWEGRLGFLAGVTPVVDSHHAVTSLLGERFVYCRFGGDRREASRRALAQRGAEPAMRAELRGAVRSFVESLEIVPPPLATATLERLLSIADFATRARTGVERDPYGREIVALPALEAPTRLAKQLAGIVSALIVMGLSEAEALERALRLGYDCLPPARLAVLRLLRDADPLRTPELSERTGLPTSTCRRVLEDLAALGLLEREAGPGGRGGADAWALSPEGAALWLEADPIDSRNVGTPEENRL